MFTFNVAKAIQAAGVLLNLHSHRRMSRIRILKLLYLADRATLSEKGHPITYDRAVAMKNGPVLSRTYDCIKNMDPEARKWQAYIETDGPIDVRLKRNPGNAHLSPYEIETLERISREHENQDDWELADETHKLPEYEKHKVAISKEDIPLEDILEALGLGEKIEEIRAENEAHASATRLFEGKTGSCLA